MKKFHVLALSVACLTLFSCAKRGDDGSPYVAKVGSAKITEQDIKNELKSLPEQISVMFQGPEGAEKFLDELVKKELLFQEAKKQGLDKDAEYRKKLDDFQKLSLISVLLKKEIEEKVRVSDKDLRDYYDAHKEEMTSGSQVRASHILVKTEDEAKQVLEQLKKEDFAKVARAKSIDTGSAKNGGDLGFFSRGQMVPEFERAAFRLKDGEVSKPVKTNFGYHIIKVTARKQGTVIEFEKAKEVISQRLTADKQKEAFDAYIAGLKKSYTVEIKKDQLTKMQENKEQKEKKAP